MDYLVQFQINVLSLLILLLLYLFVRLSKIKTFSQRLIRLIIASTAVAIVVEPLTWIFDGMTFRGAFFLEYSTNFILFLIGPVIGGLLFSYVDFRINRDPDRVVRRLYYQHISLLTLAILIVNFFYPVYFKINRVTNHFSSGDLKSVHYAALAGLYLCLLFFIFRHRHRIDMKESMIFVLCFLLPIIGMVVQLFDSKLHFSWTSIVLGLLAIYIFLETSPTEEDFLTKSYNRKSYESHLLHLMQSGRPFGIIIFDLNYFKEINDHYGHKKGDDILITFAQMLKTAFGRDGLVARLGGDEFSVVVNQQHSDVSHYIDTLSRDLSHHSDPLIKGLSFSYGYQPYAEPMTIDELYNAADHQMYLHKRSIKKLHTEVQSLN